MDAAAQAQNRWFNSGMFGGFTAGNLILGEDRMYDLHGLDGVVERRSGLFSPAFDRVDELAVFGAKSYKIDTVIFAGSLLGRDTSAVAVVVGVNPTITFRIAFRADL